MAAFDNLTDPFGSPEATSQPQQPDLASQWSKFLDDPRGKSALMNFGLSLMQPAPWGASPVATAFGAVGEGLRTQDEAAQKQQAIDTKETAAQALNDRRVAQTMQGETALGIKQNQFQLNQQRQDANEADKARLRDYQDRVLQLRQEVADATKEGNLAKAATVQKRLDLAERGKVVLEQNMEINRQRALTSATESGARVEHMGATEIDALHRMYASEKKVYDEGQLLVPRGQRAPFKDFSTWRSDNPHLDRATPTLDRPRAPAANAPQPAVDPTLDMSNLEDGAQVLPADRVLGRLYLGKDKTQVRWMKDAQGNFGWALP